MKRATIILLVGVVLGLLACFGAYAWRTAAHRAMLNSPQPELAWLQKEFKLSDSEIARIEELHQAYLPQCEEMCARIDATNALIQQQLLETSSVTAEIETLLANSAQLRVECQRQMLEHFYSVSREMSSEQGQRYLAWVRDRIFNMTHEPVERETTSNSTGHHEHH